MKFLQHVFGFGVSEGKRKGSREQRQKEGEIGGKVAFCPLLDSKTNGVSMHLILILSLCLSSHYYIHKGSENETFP